MGVSQHTGWGRVTVLLFLFLLSAYATSTTIEEVTEAVPMHGRHYHLRGGGRKLQLTDTQVSKEGDKGGRKE